MVSEPWRHAWSSCRAYACGAADASLAEHPYYREWGHDDGSRQRRWRESLLQADPEEASIRRADWAVGEPEGKVHRRLSLARQCFQVGIVSDLSPVAIHLENELAGRRRRFADRLDGISGRLPGILHSSAVEDEAKQKKCQGAGS